MKYYIDIHRHLLSINKIQIIIEKLNNFVALFKNLYRNKEGEKKEFKIKFLISLCLICKVINNNDQMIPILNR